MVIKLLSLIVIINLFKYYTFPVRSYINPTITTLAYIRETIQNTYIAIPFGIFNAYCRYMEMVATINIYFSPISGVNLGLIIFPALQFFNRFPRLTYF